MSSPSRDSEEPSSSTAPADEGPGGSGDAAPDARPPAKRRFSSTVIEISDTDSDDSDVCAVNSYQATADEVKRIRGADYSSSSSSSEYSSDSEDTCEDDSILVEDNKADVKAVRAQLNHRANRMDDPQFNPNIKSQEFIDRLSLHWKEQKDFKSGGVTLTSEPFRLCLLQDFLANSEMINNIVDDMNTLDWSRKKMDLYEFHQTADLASLTWQRSIRGIYELLKTEVMSWVSEVTGLTLRSISASCSLYGPGDHLLVHDDMLADRRVAFILYLAPWRPNPPKHNNAVENGAGDSNELEECGEDGGWSRRMGGALQQLTRDERGAPDQVVRSVYPKNNMFAFFKVGHDSYHQVEEVLSLELPRLSINGWFHGPPPPESEGAAVAAPPPPPPQRPRADVVVLSQWLEPAYMAPRSRLQIQAQMERDSEVCLRDVLAAARLPDLCTALQTAVWRRAGPADLRHHQILCEEEAPEPLRELLVLFTSTAFVRALSECTDLALTTVRGLELQRWAPGDYSLLPPREHYTTARLRAALTLIPEGENGEGKGRARAGGATSFVAPAEDEGGAALVTVAPAHNALSLVYCDPGAAAFTHYVSRLRRPPHHCFYVLVAEYCE